MMSRLVDGRVIASTPEARRMVARVILEKARSVRLFAFNLPDTHLHTGLAEDETTSTEVVRRIQSSIKRRLRLDVGFARVHVKAIGDQGHLANLFDYIMRQKGRHELKAWDPLCEASNLPDLLGLRTLGRFTIKVLRQLLPRIDRVQLLRCLEVEELAPRDGPLELVLPAALAAAGLQTLTGQSNMVQRVRCAVVELIGRRMPAVQIAALLGVERHTIHRIRKAAVDIDLLSAIRLQLGLRWIKRADLDQRAFGSR